MSAITTTDRHSARNITQMRDVPIDWIEPSPLNPRRTFDETALQELAASIRGHGLLEPLVVREIGEDRFSILAGERRWRACRIAGLDVVPVHVKQDVDD